MSREIPSPVQESSEKLEVTAELEDRVREDFKHVEELFESGNGDKSQIEGIKGLTDSILSGTQEESSKALIEYNEKFGSATGAIGELKESLTAYLSAVREQ